jgi:hypothetical protein
MANVEASRATGTASGKYVLGPGTLTADAIAVGLAQVNPLRDNLRTRATTTRRWA